MRCDAQGTADGFDGEAKPTHFESRGRNGLL